MSRRTTESLQWKRMLSFKETETEKVRQEFVWTGIVFGIRSSTNVKSTNL